MFQITMLDQVYVNLDERLQVQLRNTCFSGPYLACKVEFYNFILHKYKSVTYKQIKYKQM